MNKLERGNRNPPSLNK